MISKHVTYKAAHDDYAALARYIADAGHDGEKCLASWCAGCVADDDYELAIVEAQAVQGMNTRSHKEKTYHLLVSFRPEDEAKLTSEAFKAIERRFAAVLGYTDHQRHCGVHKNTANLHMHVAYNMVHPERHVRHEPFRDYALRDKLCRALEREFGLTVDNGREQRRDDALSQKAATIEAQTGQESFESYAKRHKVEIVQALEQDPSNPAGWQHLHETLKAYGLGIKPHGNGLVIFDLHGKRAAKASTIDRSLSAKKLQERFGGFRPYRSLRQVQEISRYRAVPLHRSPERGELYTKYKTGIETRKSKLTGIKELEDKQIAAIRQQWAEKRRGIENMNIAKRNRHNLLTLAKKHELEAIAKAKLTLLPKREAVRQEIPYTSWQNFLKLEVANGNEVALAVLRSRKEIVDLEQESSAKVTKNWLQHGVMTLKAEYAEKELTTLEADNITSKGKNRLLSVLRMERLAREENLRNANQPQVETSLLSGFTTRIDHSGTVIFTLPGGGIIRDSGKEIFFSSRDKMAEAVALLYTRENGGKTFCWKATGSVGGKWRLCRSNAIIWSDKAYISRFEPYELLQECPG